jgi:hypothetical protein
MMRQFSQPSFYTVRLNIGEVLIIHTRSTFVGSTASISVQ